MRKRSKPVKYFLLIALLAAILAPAMLAAAAQAQAADTTPPDVTNRTPVHGAWTNATPLIGYNYSDSGSGVDWPDGVHIFLDGKCTKMTAAMGKGISTIDASGIHYQPNNTTGKLANGLHNVQIVTCDKDANCLDGFAPAAPDGVTWWTFTVDGTAPGVTYSGPSGWVGSSPTITGTAADTGSGVASAKLNLNGGADIPCTVDASGNISCPASGLTAGAYSAVITARDNVGNTATASGSFNVDTTPPVISNRLPLHGSTTNASPLIGYDYADSESGVAWPADVHIMLDGKCTKMQAAMGKGISTVDASGIHYQPNNTTGKLADGLHNVKVVACDKVGNCTDSSALSAPDGLVWWTFNVSTCTAGKPSLKLSAPAASWASYADFLARRLTVTWSIANTGSTGAMNVKIVSSTPNAGVTLLTAMPAAVGNISAGGSGNVALQYFVPAGVRGFRVINTASAEDSCGNTYVYP